MPHPPTEMISGTIERITYYNPENGYSVLRVAPDTNKKDKFHRQGMSKDGVITVVGTLPELTIGELAEFSGQWQDNAKYGMQFRAHDVKPIAPTSERGITRYIANMVKGIGPRTAERIVQHFGKDTLDVLERAPHRLQEVDKLGEEKASRLAEAWANSHRERQTLIFLQTYDITTRFARKIYQEYGEDTVQVVQANPYQLAHDISGVGFIRADEIARKLGFQPDSTERIGAGLNYALIKLSQEGHTFAPRPVLVEKTAEMLGLADADLVDRVIDRQVGAEYIYRASLVVDDEEIEAIYQPVFYHSERGCTRLLRQLTGVAPRLTLAKPQAKDLDAYIASTQKQSDIQLTDQQRAAVKAVFEHKVSVLTGGPGTGKTTTLRMVLDAVEGLGRRVGLAAPTGRAAKRLQQATGREASTIHRLLEFQWLESPPFQRNEDNPLDIDLLVLDETSMLDLVLFYNVLKALPTRAHLLLVGDVDQLPSVGAGNVLRDMINSGVAHVTRLQTIFRQAQKSHIVANAHRINNGQMPYLGNDSEDFFFFRMDTADDIAAMTVDVIVNRVPRRFGFDPMRDIQALAPMYRGPVGVDALNDALQNALNSNPRHAEVTIDKQRYRVGDRVMQTRNNYDKEVFNGEGGTIRAINQTAGELEVWMDEKIVTYKYTDAEELVLAYCISIHRSQGSEYPVVVMPFSTNHYIMLQRNLLYTAITRARDLVVLVGQEAAVAMAVKNNKVEDRYSGLAARLKDIGAGGLRLI